MLFSSSKKAMKKLKSARNNLAVIRYDDDNSTFIWKHPEEDFQIGSQLIVHESQEAIFFLNGEAFDTFGPGRHTLETETLPLLNKVFNFATKKDMPFHAEVYFINYATQMGIKWGTDSRVRFVDPVSKIPFDIGASGEINLKVKNGRKLLVTLVGVAAGLLRNDFGAQDGGRGNKQAKSSAPVMVKGATYYSLSDFFRAPLMSEVKSSLASAIVTKQINIFEIDMYLETLSGYLREKIAPIFEEYGLEVPQFYVSNVSLPDDDRNFQELKTLQTKAYLDVKAEEVRHNIAKAERDRRITEEETEAQLEIIRAQNRAQAQKISAEAEAASERMKGLAEAEVMKEKGYSEKDIIEADVQKEYARSLGKINANLGSGGGTSGGGGGSVASDFINLAVGMKIAENVVGKLDNMAAPLGEKQQAAPSEKTEKTQPAQESWKCSCGAENKGAFCGSCGKPRPETWICSHCGYTGNTKKFCENCGNPKETPTWKCTKCGTEGNTQNFCGECGAKKESAAEK
ncbi:MAG: hypothetical protein E7616_07620 [Ruminococcaceae bacterium]|nr:hypothetical protein [Oscillospiraceae bacterium]